MAQAPPLTPPTRRERRPGRGNRAGAGRARLRSVPLLGFTPPRAKVSVRQSGAGGLIFGLICLRSPTFIGVRIDAAMQVADVSGIRRNIIPTPENRKVGGSTPHPAWDCSHAAEDVSPRC